MTFMLKSLKTATMVAACGGLGYLMWQRSRPAAPVRTSALSPRPAIETADPVETARMADEIEPEVELDLSIPLAAGDIDRAD